MKAIIICLLSCLSLCASDTNEIRLPNEGIRVSSWSYKVMPEDSLATIEVFTRDGQTNLIRHTHTKDGAVLFRSQSFYYHGTEVGVYTYLVGKGPDSTIAGSTAGAPYYFSIAFDSSDKPRAAHIMATNLVTLELFDCTNGIFSPTDTSVIRMLNSRH